MTIETIKPKTRLKTIILKQRRIRGDLIVRRGTMVICPNLNLIEGDLIIEDESYLETAYPIVVDTIRRLP